MNILATSAFFIGFAIFHGFVCFENIRFGIAVMRWTVVSQYFDDEWL